MKLTNLIIIISIFTLSLNAQDIVNKLGGNTTNETYDVTDSADNVLFRVQGDGGVLFNGTWATGIIPATGAGTRMMWYPKKAAFRAGTIEIGGNQWDDTNIGDYSTAVGLGTTASGFASIAMGGYTKAIGNTSTAMGWGTTASGKVSTAMGIEIEASGDYSIAIALNDQYGTNVSQDNTMAIMGGNVGIGTIAPGAVLSIVGLSVHADNAAALASGLIAGDLYRTSTGELMVTY